MKKRLLAIILCAIILLAPTGVYASALADYGRFGTYKAEIASNGGLITTTYYDNNGNRIIPSRAPSLSTNSVLPKSYDAREKGYITSVKDQGNFGTCWAFSYCALAETSLIMQGFETKDSVDISEAHLTWFSFNNYDADSSNYADRDACIVDEPYNNGGSEEIAYSTVTRWSGFAKEENFPYSENPDDMNFDFSDKYKSDYQLVSSQANKYDPLKITDMKKTILENGSVGLAYYHDNLFCNCVDDITCYYCPAPLNANHEVQVVGWDDDFSAFNFDINPHKKGAWLIKNSWGTDWGNDGYFWISYYDCSIYNYYYLTAIPSGTFNRNYQYNGTLSNGGLIANGADGYMANVFTAQDNEYIDSIGFALFNNNISHADVAIYTDVKSDTDPTGGVMQTKQQINCETLGDSGYCSVKLNEICGIKKGERFSIVVHFYSSYGKVYIPLETKSIDGLLNYSSEEGQSFISCDGKKWEDTNVKGLNNTFIKAFTVPDNKITSVEINTYPTKKDYYVGNSFDAKGLSLKVTYADGNQAIVSSGFNLSNTALVQEGKQTVSVTYGEYTVDFDVNVKAIPDDSISNLRIKKDVTLKYRDYYTPYCEVTAGRDVDYEVTFASENPQIVKSVSDTTLYAAKRGNTTVICTVTDEYGKVLTEKINITVKLTFWQWLIEILLSGWAWY